MIKEKDFWGEILMSEKQNLIRAAASCNYEAHKLLDSVISQHNGNKNILLMSVPDIILCAFTCELYLKDLLSKESADGSIPRGHKLNELFLMLSEDTRQEIESETLEGLSFFCPNETYNFLESLKKNGNAFVEMTIYF